MTSDFSFLGMFFWGKDNLTGSGDLLFNSHNQQTYSKPASSRQYINKNLGVL
ncbi:hypothetical protein AVDCRST_MAG92-1624 [uncultured Coleofasciculus sp.]|uniref:Uncharacterized protein n=1 Tax=uncultured Coleofasciculus sp. TaxID=1267456 RepID=A0A6J4I6K9_9CYAN|nr:hypothetical protein AVDCRST_MAG92-1624 [uncultured Coleofasciculus sp.]